MIRKPLVSVIVPVYNVRDYLKECLNSIIDQTYRDLEIFLVDDGSTDGSSEICDEFAKMDTRIQVIHQENAGAATARKCAALRAVGDYICFVDADDKLDSGMIAFFVENIGECDLITSGCYHEDALGKYNKKVDSFDKGIYNTRENIEYFIANMIAFQSRFQDGILPFLFNKMFRTEIVKEAMMDVDTSITYAEDRDLLFRCVLKSKAICVTHESFYYYRYREDSIMRTANEKFMSDLNNLYLSLKKVFSDHPQRDDLMRQLQLFISSRIPTITRYMGFPSETRTVIYLFPFQDLDKDCKIILYGAGKVGIDYYRQIYRKNLLEIVLWVDKEWEKDQGDYMSVVTPESIGKCEYDYVIIAVRKKELAAEIKQELMEKGIMEEKILWRMPPVV